MVAERKNFVLPILVGGFFCALWENWQGEENRMRYCEICKAVIDPERIEAIPDTRLCVEHGRQIQKHGGEFVVSASQERTSKVGSLKHNYGGIATSRARNQDAVERLRDEYEEQQSAR